VFAERDRRWQPPELARSARTRSRSSVRRMKARNLTADADLSSWSKEQEKLIKRTLLAYKSRSPGTRGLSWQGIQQDIEHLTGVAMGGKDHLRQYIAGTRPATDNAARRQALVEFLTHPDMDLMTLGEFLEPGSYLHAARRLLEYLRTDLDPVAVDSPIRRISGLYVSEAKSHSEESRIVLNITHVEDESWILRVLEERQHVSTLKHKDEFIRSESRSASSGWCVLTPEDNLLFFLKDNQYGKNHYYHLVSDLEIWTDEPYDNFLLLRYDYPEPMPQIRALKNHEIPDFANRTVADGLIAFRRLNDGETTSPTQD